MQQKVSQINITNQDKLQNIFSNWREKQVRNQVSWLSKCSRGNERGLQDWLTIGGEQEPPGLIDKVCRRKGQHRVYCEQHSLCVSKNALQRNTKARCIRGAIVVKNSQLNLPTGKWELDVNGIQERLEDFECILRQGRYHFEYLLGFIFHLYYPCGSYFIQNIFTL